MKASEFSRRALKDVVNRYLEDWILTFSDVADEFCTTPAVIRDCIKRAIVEWVATDDDIAAIEQKAKNNNGRHGGRGAEIKTERYYHELRREREKYVLPDAEKVRLVKLYAEGDRALIGMSIDFCMSMKFLTDAVRDVIQRKLIDVETEKQLGLKILRDKSVPEGILVVKEEKKTEPKAEETVQKPVEQLSFFENEFTTRIKEDL